SSPSMSGIMMSITASSGRASWNLRSASPPLAARTTWCPALLRTSWRTSSTAGASSATRILAMGDQRGLIFSAVRRRRGTFSHRGGRGSYATAMPRTSPRVTGAGDSQGRHEGPQNVVLEQDDVHATETGPGDLDEMGPEPGDHGLCRVLGRHASD